MPTHDDKIRHLYINPSVLIHDKGKSTVCSAEESAIAQTLFFNATELNSVTPVPYFAVPHRAIVQLPANTEHMIRLSLNHLQPSGLSWSCAVMCNISAFQCQMGRFKSNVSDFSREQLSFEQILPAF